MARLRARRRAAAEEHVPRRRGRHRVAGETGTRTAARRAADGTRFRCVLYTGPHTTASAL
jgi:hypothetical protein